MIFVLSKVNKNCPKSGRNHCVIEVCSGVFVLSLCILDLFSCCKDFCHRAESDLFLFLLRTLPL